MKKKLYILFVLIFVTGSLISQVSYLNQLSFNNLTAEKNAGNLNLHMDVDVSKMDVSTQHMVVLTPVLNSVDGVTKLDLPAIIINGKTRDKALSRAMNLGGEKLFRTAPQTIFARINGTNQTIPYDVSFPLEDWMKKATLTIKEQVKACADCELGQNQTLLSERLLPKDLNPTYQLTYITPKAEPVKQRSEKHDAYLNFKVGKADILPDFGNNAAELAKVDQTIREVQNDKDLTVTNLSISGYASPEGSVKMNRDLSEKRARAFADYLAAKYTMPKDRFKVNWYGEDWAGLKNAVEKSSIADKNAILNIINTVSNPDLRDAPLKKLSGGTTYKTLLETYYPPLRRNEYTIAYVARAFDVNEAREVIKTRPQLLSLNEMFLVSQTYDKGSREFKDVFDVAARMYPNDPVANINAATVELEGGNADAAYSRLQKFEGMPDAWNNIGVALVMKQRYEEALGYFDRAAARGNTTAKLNAEQLRLFLADQK